jgi:sn-glycerol 3-phosphate transport system substrate-binding protein
MSTLRTLSALALVAAAPAAFAADFEFWHGNTGGVATAIDAACAAFNASQSAHKVTCIGMGGYEEGMQKAIAAFRSGTHPVLIQFFDAGTLDLMLSGAVVPVSEIMPDVDWADYIPGARSYYETSQGALFSQPYNASTLLFYTNRALLAQAGVTETPETWEEVIAAARALKAAGIDCPFVTDGHPWRLLEQFSARHGVPIATKANGYGGLDAEYVFNTGLVADHMANLAQWRAEGLVRLNEDTRAGNYTAAFNTGECAMMEASSGSYAAAFKALGATGTAFTGSMAPVYAGVERRNTLVGGASIWVMKGHDAAAYAGGRAFLDFLRAPEVQLAFVKATGYVPVTQTALDALAASPEADAAEFATAKVGIDSMNQPGDENSRGIRLGFYVQFRDIFIEETQKAFNGDQTMQVALDTAAARGNELLRRFEQTYDGVTLP